MRRTISTIFMATAAFFLASCSSSQKKEEGSKDADTTESSIMTGEDSEYIELTKDPLPCSKELLSAAWKQIGEGEASRGKALNYKQHAPTLFISTDLDGDGSPEVLLRGEPPYAAIFAYVNDSLQLITHIDQPQLGLGITPDGVIIRSGTQRDGSFLSQFIKMEKSQIVSTGEFHESFAIQNNEMVSSGTKYLLQGDSALTEVSKEAYLEVSPKQNSTYFEDLEDWEDFRKP